MTCNFGTSSAKIRVVADSGAALTVFPRYLVPSGTPLYSSRTRLKSATGHNLCNDGTITLVGSLGKGKPAQFSAIVSSDLFGPPLVCLRDLETLGAVSYTHLTLPTIYSV